MDELQAGVEQSLAVLPQPSVLLQPGKAALDDPALWHDLEGMQLTALGDLYRHMLAQNVPYALGKMLTGVATVTQQALHLAENATGNPYEAGTAPRRTPHTGPVSQAWCCAARCAAAALSRQTSLD